MLSSWGTRTPARIFGMPNRGQIAPGQVADLVLWSGDPLEVTSVAEQVWIWSREGDNLGCVVPLMAGGSGIFQGPAFLHGVASPAPADLDSHFRYLSGLLFAIGLAFASCIPSIQRKTARFRLLALLVFVGGLGRLYGLVVSGVPGTGHVFGLVMELGTVPLLVLWQSRVARRWADGGTGNPPFAV